MFMYFKHFEYTVPIVSDSIKGRKCLELTPRFVTNPKRNFHRTRNDLRFKFVVWGIITLELSARDTWPHRRQHILAGQLLEFARSVVLTRDAGSKLGLYTRSINHNAMNKYESGGTSPHILSLCNTCKWLSTSRPGQGAPPVPTDRRLHRP